LIHGILHQDGLAGAIPFGIKQRALVDRSRKLIRGGAPFNRIGRDLPPNTAPSLVMTV
jgi:hypothetical protein